MNSINDELRNTNKTLEGIDENISNLIKKPRFPWALFFSAFSLMASIFAICYSVWSGRQSFREQQKTQAYSYWQNFLALTVQYPEFADGIDRIDGFSICDISKFDKDAIKKHDSIHSVYVKYAWFVSNAIGAAEIVWDLQKGDSNWESTLKQVLGNYKGFYNSKSFFLSDYSSDMQDLIRKSMGGDPTNRCP